MKKTTILVIVTSIIWTIFSWMQVDALTLSNADINFINQQINTNHDKIKNRLSWYKSYTIKRLYKENINTTNSEKQNDIWTYIIWVLQVKNNIKIYDINTNCDSSKNTNLIWCDKSSHSSATTTSPSSTSPKRRTLSVPTTTTNTNKVGKDNNQTNINNNKTENNTTPSPQTNNTHQSADISTNFIDNELKIDQRENATINIHGKNHKVVIIKYSCSTSKPTDFKQGYFYFHINTDRKFFCQSEPEKFYIDGINNIDINWFRSQLLSLINNLRKQNGLGELNMDNTLNAIAEKYSDYMFANLHFDHTDKDWKTLYNRLDDGWYRYSYYWENLAKWAYTAKEVFDGRYSSQLHKENLLNPNFDSIGLGRDGTYVDGVFAKKKIK